MNIAISGRLGSGKSTVCGILKEKYGFEVYSTGKIQRRFAEEMGISTLELNKRMVGDNELDHFIDNGVRELSRKDKDSRIIFDSRMAWHFAENRFAVYVFADPTVAAKRVFDDTLRGNVEKYESVEDAKNKLYARSREENRRYRELYGVDNFLYSNYDLVIDSTYLQAEVVADTIFEQYSLFCTDRFEKTKLLFSPKTVLPTVSVANAAQDRKKTSVCYAFDANFVISGHAFLSDALRSKADFIEAELVDITSEQLIRLAKELGVEGVARYEQAGDFCYSDIPDIFR